MTGTGLCVNKPQSVPVIPVFEPHFILRTPYIINFTISIINFNILTIYVLCIIFVILT
jgi:hypothetical protein